MDNLSNNIEELTIYKNNVNIDNLPNSIKKIIIFNSNDLNNLPNSIEELILIKNVVKINKIPKKLNKIHVTNFLINLEQNSVLNFINILNDIYIKNENNKLKYYINENISKNEKYNNILFTINKNLNNFNININKLLKETQSVITGSLISSCICNQSFENEDIDIFTHNEEQFINEELLTVNNNLNIDNLNYLKLNNYIKKIYNCTVNKKKIQIIVLKEETTIKEAIEQFDLSCCKLFYDGENVCSINNNLMQEINDIENYKASYNLIHIDKSEFLTIRIIKDMERIQKYIKRDFSIINLNEDNYYNKIKKLLINTIIKNYFGINNLKNKKLFDILKKGLNF